MEEQHTKQKFTNEEIVKQLEKEGYTKGETNEEQVIVEKDGYEFTIKDFIVHKIEKVDIILKELEKPTFNYNGETEVGAVRMEIIYPSYARIKEYKIGAEGEWHNYMETITLMENTTIYAKYTADDKRTSEEVSETISNINRVLRYTNAGAYWPSDSEDTKINRVNHIFERNNNDNYQEALSVCFKSWCEEEVYFQDNKSESIEASKVTIKSLGNDRGFEPLKEFYITASDTVDFQNEVELYRSEHTVTVTNQVITTEHHFEPKGSFRYYRLYVTSWWPCNGYIGQHVLQCYIE